MRLQVLVQLFCLTALATDQIEGDLTDYLQGKGNFSSINVLKSWTNTNTDDFTVQVIDTGNEKALELQRIAGEISFQDGYTISILPSQPQHLRFYFASTNKEIEDTNLRLKDSSSGKTAVSFRCGYAGFVRVNDNQMVMFYNDTITNVIGTQIWSKADIIMDWGQKTVQIYVNESYQGSANFYHEEITTVNTLLLYNLNPDTTSYWKDLQICNERCANFNIGHLIQITTVSLILILIYL